MDLQATLAGSFTFTIWRPPGMKSSRCPLVACSDVMGSSVTDILGAAEALAPAVIGEAIGSEIRETGPNRRRHTQPRRCAEFPGPRRRIKNNACGVKKPRVSGAVLGGTSDNRICGRTTN